ncbi:LEA type 2 family protein [uncultured Cyclobacterium sp.]|uniref:LEA type 2 family protein n=1 Tax=uncultured Cyclobacterium sp. TaxID=453820 RepID=UPI0030ED5ED9
MKTPRIIQFLLFIGSCLLLSCSTNLMVLEDMLPRAKQQSFNVKFDQTSLVDFAVNFDLVYEISNPYKKELPIPDHVMGIFVDGKDIGLAKTHEGVLVPPKSTTLLNYSFTINSNQLRQLLGKNNNITFRSAIELDLTDYTNMLPNFQLAVSEDFDLESSELKPYLNKLLQKKISKFDFSYEHSAQIKIPAPPVISKSNQPIEIKLLGEGSNLINPNAIKTALIPFGDLLVNGEMAGLKDPFIDAVVSMTVPVPDPVIENIFRTKDVKIENYMLDLIRPFDSQINTKWNNTKALMYRNSSFKLTDYFVDNILDPAGFPDASEKWDIFQTSYNQFKYTVFPDQLPGPQTRGFEILIPFTFKNQNEFPISIPIFRSSVILPGGQPFTMYVKPKDMGEINLGEVPSNQAEIPAKQSKTLYVVFSFDMKAFNQGIYSLFMKNQFEPNLGGIMSYDFGYGPLYIGYDLKNMSLDYK